MCGTTTAFTSDTMEKCGSRGMTRVSLLELMQSQSCDHSAESTAQKLLQHMAGCMTGCRKDASQMVRCHVIYGITVMILF